MSIEQHLPVLPIIVPLLAAPLCVMIRERRTVYAVVVSVTLVLAALTGWLMVDVLQHGSRVYALGGWPAPWGIEYRVDALSVFFLWLVASLGCVVAIFGPSTVEREIAPAQQPYFYTAYLLCLTGLLGIVITGDLFNLFVFLEISSLSSYALISLGQSRRALVATFQYLVMGTIGATFVLIGIGLCYQMTGSLNMIELAELLPAYTQGGNNRTALVAFAFLSVGISIKTAIFPLHQWLPNAYACAPTMVTAFLASTSTKVSVYVLLRVIFTIFTPAFAFGTLPFDVGLMTFSLIGILVASATAIFQSDIKRLLAYSSVAQIGYIVLGISVATQAGVSAAVLHVFNHAVIKGGLFMATGCLALRLPSLGIDELAGIGRRMPWTSMAFVLGGLGLIGVPLTSGFVSKWYLIVATIEVGYRLPTILVLCGSLLAIIYVWRVVEVVYFREPTGAAASAVEAPLSMLVPTYLLIGTSLVFGCWTTLPASWAAAAASAIMGG